MYSILWTPFQFFLIIFCLDICRLCSTLTRLSKGCPDWDNYFWPCENIPTHFLVLGRSSICAWLGGVCGCLPFYERFPDELYIKLAAIPSNILHLHHVVSECGKMRKICWIWRLIISVLLFSPFIYFQFKIYSVLVSTILLSPFLEMTFIWLFWWYVVLFIICS